MRFFSGTVNQVGGGAGSGGGGAGSGEREMKTKVETTLKIIRMFFSNFYFEIPGTTWEAKPFCVCTTCM